MSLVKILLNGEEVQVEAGTTILEAARRNGVRIPTLCNDDQLEPFTSCWLCAVKLEGVRRYVPSCGTRVSEGMKVWTDTEDVRAVRRMALELLLSNHRGDCIAPCKAACPAGVDVQGYIALVAQGQYREAVRLVKEVNPFPLAIGRVCTRPCEGDCRRNAVDGPVGIDYLKRFAADWDIGHDEPFSPAVGAPSGKRVAAVGAGPASLTLAYYLRQKGHAVTVFEALPAGGGMLRYGIPEYRLPKQVLDKEIGLIAQLGADVRYGKALGRDFRLGDLLEQGYDAVFLGLGAMGSRKMKVPGEDLDGVWAGTEFLKKMGLGEKVEVGRHVAIIGGGNTAIDAARTSLRLGAEKVTVVYRRSRAEMPAWDVEVEAALQEGVEMHFLAAPTRIEGDGRCERLEYIQMELGEPDESGRRRPVPIEGSEQVIEVDNVIAAIGQLPDLTAIEEAGGSCPDALENKLELTRWGTIVADEVTGATSVDRVFAGGDVVTGAATAIEAIAAGGRAAAAIDRLLSGEEVSLTEPFFNIQKERWDSFPEDELADVERAPRQEMDELPDDERIRTFDEVELGYSEEQAIAETRRCLECGCIEGFTCRLREYAAEYGATAGGFEGEVVSDSPDERHPFVKLEPEKCILCGRCVRICEQVQGAAALGFFRRGFVAQMKPGLNMPLAETSCESCGQCITTCPTAAISSKVELPKPGPWAARASRSTCSFCGTGCQTVLNTVGDELVSVTPVPTGIDGSGNLCVRGRFGPSNLRSMERLTSPMSRGPNGPEATEWSALDHALGGLKRIADEHGPDSVAVFVSPRATNEEAYLLRRLGEEGLSTSQLASFGASAERPLFEALERAFGLPAATVAHEDVEAADCILLFDSDLAEEHTVLGLSVRKAVGRGATLVVVSPQETRMSRLAGIRVNCERQDFGDVISALIAGVMESGAAPDSVRETEGLTKLMRIAGAAGQTYTMDGGTMEDVAKALATCERSVIVANAWSFEPTRAARHASLIAALSVVSGSTTREGSGVLFMRSRANGQGLSEAGVREDAREILHMIESSRIKGALIFGEDPVGGASDPLLVQEALGRLECLVVADVAMTETASLTHHVVPLGGPAEVCGSYVTGERAVRPVGGPLDVPGDCDNLKVIVRMGRAVGVDLGSADHAEALSAFLTSVGQSETGGLPADGLFLTRHEAPPPCDLRIPSQEAAELQFDPRWTDVIEAGFAGRTEREGLRPHVVKRYAVRT